MYTITADIVNAFSIPESEKYPERYNLQLMGDTFTKDGQVRKDMITFSIPKDQFDELKNCVGQTVTLPVAFFVNQNKIRPYYPKATPTPRTGSPRGTSADA